MNKLIVLTICFLLFFFRVEISNAQQSKGEMLCIDYIKNFKPVYIDGEDSLVAARLPEPDPDLSAYLEECLNKQDFGMLKYSYVVINLLSDEHSAVSKMTYTVSHEAKSNGFIRLALAYMAMKESTNYHDDVFFFEVSECIYKHRSEISGFGEARKKYLKKRGR